MIKIGEHQTLKIVREMPQGFYLEDEEGDEVLFPQKYITESMKEGDDIEVFVYCDSNDRNVATTEQPMMTLGKVAILEVMEVNNIGAFCEWGVNKQLFVPFRNQLVKMLKGHKYPVYLILDEVSDRLVGSTKLNSFFESEVEKDTYELGQEVAIKIYAETDIGYRVLVNDTHLGLIYKNETHTKLAIGHSSSAYVKPYREDKKIDLSLYPLGHKSIEPNADLILQKLNQNGGQLPFTDKSDPNLIREEFGISKKLFKKAIGNLYKKKIITLAKDGISLIENKGNPDNQ